MTNKNPYVKGKSATGIKEVGSNHKFKSLEKTLDTILELNVINSIDELIDDNNCPVDGLGRLLVEALKKDIENYNK